MHSAVTPLVAITAEVDLDEITSGGKYSNRTGEAGYEAGSYGGGDGAPVTVQFIRTGAADGAAGSVIGQNGGGNLTAARNPTLLPLPES